MEVSPLSSTSAASGTDAAIRSLTQDFDTFLTLLTTQLQYQDPLSPMDSTEFTNQVVQFSSLEQQITQTDRLDELLALQESGHALSAVNYLGNSIEAAGNVAILANGEATMGYELPADTSEATVTIFDASGTPLKTLTAETGTGLQTLVWDGTDDQGVPQADGAYAAELLALDDTGKALSGGTMFFSGVASEVTTIDGATFIMLGDYPVAIGDILAVRPPAEAPAA